MSFQRVFLAVVAGLGAALVAYGVVFTHGNPHPTSGDPLLAARLWPLEGLLGLIVGGLVYRAVGFRQATAPRPDAQERMVYRLAMRKGGRFTEDDLRTQFPLDPDQARDLLGRMQAAGRLRRDGDTYHLA